MKLATVLVFAAIGRGNQHSTVYHEPKRVAPVGSSVARPAGVRRVSPDGVRTPTRARPGRTAVTIFIGFGESHQRIQASAHGTRWTVYRSVRNKAI